MVRGLFSLLLFFCFIGLANAAPSVEARVDRSEVTEGETFTLELIQRDDDSEPDVSPLLIDFEIISTSRSRQMSIVNGSMDSTTSWRYVLSPIRSGALLIPSITSGSVKTEPLNIQVTPATSASTETREIFLEVSVDNKKPYVQSQVIYTVKIFRARDFYDGSLSDPKSSDFIHQRLGEDTSYRLQKDGTRYTVIQRRYVMFPQKSGELSIPPIVLSATVAANTSSQGTFGGLITQGRPVRLRSESITLDVQAAPGSYPGQWWLPAQSVKIGETWSEDLDEWRVGTPITRTLNISAQGIQRGQLPGLPLPKIEGLKIYSDQPELSEQATLDGLAGLHTERWAIIPSKAGDYLLPELQIAWWNVNSDRQEYAVLPARRIQVLPAIGHTGITDSPPKKAVTTVLPDNEGESDSETVFEDVMAAPETLETEYSFWPWLLAFALLGWFLTIVFFLRKPRLPIQQSRDYVEKNKSLKTILKELVAAISNHDLVGVRSSLLQWGRACWAVNPPGNLVELAERIENRELAKTVFQIDAAIYARNAGISDVSQEKLVEMLESERQQMTEEPPGDLDTALPRF